MASCAAAKDGDLYQHAGVRATQRLAFLLQRVDRDGVRVGARVVSPLQQRLALLELALLVVLLRCVPGERGTLPPRVILDGQRQRSWRL